MKRDYNPADWPRLYRVSLTLCAACLAGDGDTCWTPGCALWCQRVPQAGLMVYAHSATNEPVQ